MSGLPRRDQAEVRIKHDSELSWGDATEEDYETVEVADHITVIQEHHVNSVNGHETFTDEIVWAHGLEPDAVTERIAEYVWHEFGISGLSSMGIRVVDIESDDVWVS